VKLSLRRLLLPVAAFALAACGASGSRRGEVRLPDGVHKIALRQIVNKSQQASIETTLLNTLRDEFLRDARAPLVPEAEADGVIAVTITRYTLTPIQYDYTLAPLTYRLSILVDVDMVQKSTGNVLWTEKGLEGAMIYPAATMVGGSSEAAQSTEIWTILSPMIVQRVLEGRRD
jgi:hypothetical protein